MISLNPRHQLRAALLVGAVLLIPGAALVLVATTAVPNCHLQVIPDYVTPISYQAVLRVSPGCPPGAVLRVRKSSTLNTRRGGAPVQPIKPLTGAWEVGWYARPERLVPLKELTTNTFTRWRWEYWDASTPNARTNSLGRWLAAEVLHAEP